MITYLPTTYARQSTATTSREYCAVHVCSGIDQIGLIGQGHFRQLVSLDKRAESAKVEKK